jgi:hypothetical protein
MFARGQVRVRPSDADFERRTQITFLQVATAGRAITASQHSVNMEAGFAFLIGHGFTGQVMTSCWSSTGMSLWFFACQSK